jgi:hypothetical protein
MMYNNGFWHLLYICNSIYKQFKDMAYTWVKTHQDIVNFLRDKRNQQKMLITMLKNAGVDGGFIDRDDSGQPIPLNEIDPFTFFRSIYKYGNDRCLQILKKIAQAIKSSPLPTDVQGIPLANPQSAWLFPYQTARTNQEVNRLWDFFEKVLTDTVDESDFINILSIKGVGKAKLTEGLFCVKPTDYLPINNPVRQYLEQQFKLKPDFESFTNYKNLIYKVQKELNESFYEISYRAWAAKDGLIELLSVEEAPIHNDIITIYDNMNNSKFPLNQILYGSPGTGKTYHSINKALEIIGFDIANKDRATIKNAFDEYAKKGQIIFTTFHQSMSYEDFIEGIKPETIDNQIVYSIRSGIFKNICQAARTPNSITFSKVYDNLRRELTETDMIAMKTPKGSEFSVSLNSNGNLNLHTGIHRTKQGVLTKENIQKQINGEEKFVGWEGYFHGVIDYLKSKYNYSNTVADKQFPNYVLIIDEINRGNVSQIFGELITLIEESKRLGKEEALEIMLPYSKQMFGVPSNLYIIGTMNTADRSIEALDTALRRRFVFQEMMPNPKLLGKIEDFELSNLLTIINERIEVLLNRDNLIGHSYFLNVASLDDLKNVFFNNIIPLLQEYFYGDYGKIGLVLGEGFVKLKPSKAKFAKFNYDNDLSEKKVYEIIENTKDFDIVNALKCLLNE